MQAILKHKIDDDDNNDDDDDNNNNNNNNNNNKSNKTLLIHNRIILYFHKIIFKKSCWLLPCRFTTSVKLSCTKPTTLFIKS